MTEEMVPPNVREDLKVWVMKESRSAAFAWSTRKPFQDLIWQKKGDIKTVSTAQGAVI